MSPCCVPAVALATALVPHFAVAAPLSLEAALEMAVQRSEAARSGRAGVASASELVRAAGQLPDPMLRLGAENLPVTGTDRFSTARDSMTMKRIGVSQEWLSSEKRAARQAAADAAVGRESVAAEASVAETRLQTALAYVDAYYAGEALKLTTLLEHHAHEELEAARARLSSATGTGEELLASVSASGIAADESADARQRQRAADVVLRRWVGMPVAELLPASVPIQPDGQTYAANYPTVVAIQHDIELARKAAAVASSERSPNWSWELSYGQRSGYADMVSFGVSIPLQIARDQRQDRETASRLARVDKAEAELVEATRAAMAEYEALASDCQGLQERIERYRTDVVTPVQQRTLVAIAAYRSNQATLMTLFQARHAEVEAQRKLLMLERDLAKARALLAFKPLTPGAPS